MIQQMQHRTSNRAAVPSPATGLRCIPVQGNLPFCALISCSPKSDFSITIFKIHACSRARLVSAKMRATKPQDQ